MLITTFTKAAVVFFWLSHGNYFVPPKAYDYAPKKTPIILYTDELSVPFACGEPVGREFHNGDFRIQACARELGSRCLIILPFASQVSTADEEGLWRHERAHCNGWKHPEEHSTPVVFTTRK